jgi:hypothetical protein
MIARILLPFWLMVAGLGVVAAAGSARAEPVPGAGDAAFSAALADWLADDDEAALPALAALAADGNRAARILVSLIDRMPHAHGRWIAGRTRAERRALMRDPEGRAWIASAADVPLAALWLALWEADTDPEAAFAFADLGEHRAARQVLLAHAARQGSGFAALAADPRYPDAVRFLAWAERPEAEETRREVATRPRGDPQRARFAPAADDAALAAWLAEDELAAPLRVFCDAACPEEVGACLRAAYRGVGGYRGLLALGSPSETLVPAEAWLGSEKGILGVPRRIALLRSPSPEVACVARAVALAP